MTRIYDFTPPANSAGVSVSQGDVLMADIAQKFQKLAAVTAQLNDATDKANAAFRATEEILAKLGVGIEADELVLETPPREITTPDEEQRVQDFEQVFLMFTRISGKFRIGFLRCVVTQRAPRSGRAAGVFVGDDRRVADLIPWDQASREWKLEGVAKLPELIECIADEAERVANTATEATAKVDAILRDLSAVVVAK